MKQRKSPAPSLLRLMREGAVDPALSQDLDALLVTGLNAVLARIAAAQHQPYERVVEQAQELEAMRAFTARWEPVMFARPDMQWVKCTGASCLYNQWAPVNRAAPVVCPYHQDRIIDLPFYVSGNGTVLAPCGACDGTGRVKYTGMGAPWSVKCPACGGEGKRIVPGLPDGYNPAQPYQHLMCFACERVMQGVEPGLATLDLKPALEELGVDGTPLTRAKRMDLQAKLAVHTDNREANRRRRTMCNKHLEQYGHILAALTDVLYGVPLTGVA